ncbi:MAG: hypothetical protein MJZ32_00345 [Bacteroidaceae bacterium]|nr:hypothetical protein [Bacteroidaceae bacterium]
MEDNVVLNEHNKQEFAPAHTAEHLLNGLVAQRFGCGRAFSAHVERKKSKLDYHLDRQMTAEEIASLEAEINRIIKEDVEVWTEFVTQDEVRSRFDMNRLPDDASETVRIVHIGNYDECLCVGKHVQRTGEIIGFRISSSRWENGVQRLVFRVDAK